MVVSIAPRPSLCTASRVRKASRRVSQIYDRHLAPYELTVTQFGVLAQLKATPGVGVGALAATMIMDATTLSRNLRPLERRGFVVAEVDRDDARLRKLKLTSSGRATLDRAFAGWRAAQKQVEQALGGPAETGALNATLDRALERLAGLD